MFISRWNLKHLELLQVQKNGRYFEIPNIKITKVEIFDFFIFEFIFYFYACLNYSKTEKIYIW